MILDQKKIFPVILYLGCLLLFFSCKQRENKDTSASVEFSPDDASIKVIYSDITFSIPSPNQTALLIKNNKLPYYPELVGPLKKTETYTTTFKKAIILGIRGADLSYLNLYSQKEIALPYFNNLHSLIEELEITKPFQPEFFNKTEEHFGNNDSLMFYLSELYLRCDEYLKYNERNDISALIITGGWVESFYFLTKLYTKTNDKQIFALILYQKEVIDNLIKILAPLYNKTAEYTDLTNDLTNIAYEFDVIDIETTLDNITTDTLEQYTFIKNNTQYILSGSQLNNLAALSSQLRDKYIN